MIEPLINSVVHCVRNRTLPAENGSNTFFQLQLHFRFAAQPELLAEHVEERRLECSGCRRASDSQSSTVVFRERSGDIRLVLSGLSVIRNLYQQ